MNSTEFITFIDEAIKQEMLLGGAKNDIRLNGLRNIKSDFNYILSRNSNLTAADIVKKLHTERSDNAELYNEQKRQDLWLQEYTEKLILEKYLPKEPSKEEVLKFLTTLNEIPKKKSSFKKYQTACTEKFGQNINSQIILEFINS